MRKARSAAILLLAAIWSAATCSTLWAGSLQISTTTIEVPAPGMATSMQLRNAGSAPINVQIRAYEWNQRAGIEQLVETERVIASPPFAVIAPGREFTIRVVRLAARPGRTEDSFRLLVDELPGGRAEAGLGVKFSLRYSIPVFFTPPGLRPVELTWTATATRGAVVLSATNKSERRARIASLRLVGTDGRPLVEKPGLVGYVLGNSSMSWRLPTVPGIGNRQSAVLQASTEGGSINAAVPLAPPR